MLENKIVAKFFSMFDTATCDWTGKNAVIFGFIDGHKIRLTIEEANDA